MFPLGLQEKGPMNVAAGVGASQPVAGIAGQAPPAGRRQILRSSPPSENTDPPPGLDLI